jgi:hypothetical protein
VRPGGGHGFLEGELVSGGGGGGDAFDAPEFG